MREVLLGSDPLVKLTRRAVDQLAVRREESSSVVYPGGNVIFCEDNGDLRWSTWAGFRTNATLTANLSEVTDRTHRLPRRPDSSRFFSDGQAYRRPMRERRFLLVLSTIQKVRPLVWGYARPGLIFSTTATAAALAEE